MADTEQAPLTQGTESTVPRLRLGEVGQPGLTVLGGSVLESCQYELQWPQCIYTFDKMRRDATISSAIQLLETMISKVKWEVEIPSLWDLPGDTKERLSKYQELKKKKKFIEEVIQDMDCSLLEVIKEISSFNTYGFCVMEKVFRRRLRSQGSYYNDGLVGIKKIVPRAQETIAKWEYDEDNRELTGVRQWYRKNNGAVNEFEIAPGKLIPREKFMLFRANSRRGSPTGTSPLVYCWESWKFKKALEESEAVGVAKDLRGLPILTIPAQYMSDGASESDKAVYEYLKRVIRNVHRDEQEGLILPGVRDESGQKLFEFELAGVTGSKSYNVGEIINRYSNEILMSFFADVLKLGQGATGSYSLADSKTSIIATRIEAALMEIQDQFNNDLIKQLAQLNGWNPVDMPKLVYGDIDERDIDVLSSALQRTKATGLVAPTPRNINYVAEQLGLPDRVDENMPQDELNELLGQMTSESGSGMVEGMSNGTGSSNGGSGDSSVGNKENSAFVPTYTIIHEDADFIDVEMNGQVVKWMRKDWENSGLAN